MQSSAAKAGRIDPVTLGFQAAVTTFGRPLKATIDGGDDMLRRFREGDRLVQENDALKARLNAMALYEERIGHLEEEVDGLRTLNKLGPLPGHERVSADVVDFAQYEGRITLSVGTERGVGPNMPVISADGLVAIVQTAWKGGCQAALITNAGVQVGGLDLSRKPATAGILKGRDPSTLVLTFFDPNASAQTGDTVVTSGYSSRIPRLLRVGKIYKMEDDPDYGIRRAMVLPFMDLGALKEVQILR